MLKTLSIPALMVALASAVVAQEKLRVLVLTDISNEPGDEESPVRFLVYPTNSMWKDWWRPLRRG